MAEKYIVKLLWFYVFDLFLMISIIKAHQQCSTFDTPIIPNPKLKFCSNYESFSCCDRKIDLDIQKLYNSVMPNKYIDKCKHHLKEILCQECNPESSHFYNFNQIHKQQNLTGIRILPNICPKFCKKVYNECNSMFDTLSRKMNLKIKSDFCQTVNNKNLIKCYPRDKIKKIVQALRSDACMCVQEIANVTNPVFLVGANDTTGRLFIVQQNGIILILTKERKLLDEPFLDIKDQVVFHESEFDERGLLGLAFHPNFKVNRRFYIQYNINPVDKANVARTRLSVLSVDENHPNKASKSTEKIILEFDKPFPNHNGGMLFFGLDDGYLYLSPGDGGGAGDPFGNGQNKATLLGKVLRIDVNNDTPDSPYKVPEDNPFINEPGARKEIYAYGIRNSWRCSQDRGDKIGNYRGRIFCGDVGQDLYEEINIIEKGGNYGWNAREGMECYNMSLCGKIGMETLPITVYSHKEGISITGGYVYRGCKNPTLEGLYIFGDWGNGKLWVLEENTVTKTWARQDLKMCTASQCSNGLQSTFLQYIVSFGEDDKGEIYILSRSSPSVNPTASESKIYKIVSPQSDDNTSCN